MRKLALILLGTFSMCQAQIIPYAGVEFVMPEVGLSIRSDFEKATLGYECDIVIGSLGVISKAQVSGNILAPIGDHFYLRGGVGVSTLLGSTFTNPVLPLSIGYQDEGKFFDAGCNIYISMSGAGAFPAPMLRGGLRF